MEDLLAGLLRDLERRCVTLEGLLAALPPDPDTAAHALESYEVLERARRDAGRLALEPDLAEPSLSGNYLRLFERLAERVRLIEWMVIPFLARYDDADRFLTAVTRRLIDESRLPVRPPLVGGFSTQYYWTFPPYSVIAVPAGEAESILGLADLCHELGHMVLADHEVELVGTFPTALARYVQSGQAQMVADQRPPRYVDDFVSHFARWEDDWLLEFVSDMVAAFLAGPAFGFQHVRLCAGLGRSPYSPGLGEWAEHPADCARLEAIVAVIEIMGDVLGASRVRQLWADYMGINGEAEPADYKLCYPASLLQELAREIVGGCQALGVRTYRDAASGDVIAHVLRAWDEFLRDASGYPRYEEEVIARLK
jgi:hypothetical protein